MDNFWNKNRIFFGIITGAVIIGIFVYFGIKDSGIPCFFRSQKTQTESQIASPPKVGIMSDIVQTGTCGASENAIVTKVIDGDTIVVEGGWHVRLLGMDADEKGYPCYEQAKMRLEKLVLGKMVKLKKDVSNVDQYGRCLRYVFLENENVNIQLVKEGLSIARFYQPDVKYKKEIANAEVSAQQNKIGCKWSGVSETTK